MGLISASGSAGWEIAGLLGLHSISRDCTLLVSGRKMPILILVIALSLRQAEWVLLRWQALPLLCNLSGVLRPMQCAIRARCMISRWPAIHYLAYLHLISRVYPQVSISGRYAG